MFLMPVIGSILGETPNFAGTGSQWQRRITGPARGKGGTAEPGLSGADCQILGQ